MGARQKLWAAKKRLQLIESLGGKCVQCEESDANKLAFDHIREEDRDWDCRKTEWSHRMSIYAREIAEGKIQLLCETCNSKKAQNKRWQNEAHQRRIAAESGVPLEMIPF